MVGPSPVQPRLQLVRPLLNLPKSELERFARSRGIAFREDETNRSTDILRNRIRHELLPLLVSRFQPSLTKVVVRQMEILRDEAEVHDQAALAWLAGARKTAFEAMPVALQRRVLQLQTLKLGINADFDLIEKLRQEGETPVLIGPRVALVRDKAGLVRRQSVRALSFAAGRKLVKFQDGTGAGEFDGVSWRARAVRRPGSVLPRQAGTEWFDAERVGNRVILRHWQRGDRFQPSGMPRPVKLQDLFTNLKVPAAERRERVVATTAAGELWWVEGLRIAETFKIQPDTRRALKWQWRRAKRAGHKATPG
jgi:tRNA(Ile)-lysidine synthase